MMMKPKKNENNNNKYNYEFYFDDKLSFQIYHIHHPYNLLIDKELSQSFSLSK